MKTAKTIIDPFDTFHRRGSLMYYSPEGLHGIIKDTNGAEYYFIMEHEAHLIGQEPYEPYLPDVVEFDLVFNHQLKVHIAQNVKRVEPEGAK